MRAMETIHPMTMDIVQVRGGLFMKQPVASGEMEEGGETLHFHLYVTTGGSLIVQFDDETFTTWAFTVPNVVNAVIDLRKGLRAKIEGVTDGETETEAAPETGEASEADV